MFTLLQDLTPISFSISFGMRPTWLAAKEIKPWDVDKQQATTWNLGGWLYAETTQEAKQFSRYSVKNKAKAKTNRTTNNKRNDEFRYRDEPNPITDGKIQHKGEDRSYYCTNNPCQKPK